MSDAVRLHVGQAMGQKNLGYGHLSSHETGRNPGYAKGGSVHMAHKHHHVPTAGHHNMDGHIGKGTHHHTHKSHGHGLGVHHAKTGSPVHGTGSGGASTGAHQSDSKGPSDNQFGSHMPSGNGSTLGRW